MYLDNNICVHCFVERILNDNEQYMYEHNQLHIDCSEDDECYYCGEWGPIVTGYSYCDDCDDDNIYDDDAINNDEDTDDYDDYDNDYDDDHDYDGYNM